MREGPFGHQTTMMRSSTKRISQAYSNEENKDGSNADGSAANIKSEQSFDLATLSAQNWYEVRVHGKNPERRGYHSSFVHGSK